ncbi:heavy-metal-associated domain-containing protein [Georgenia wangjunii]|uniref:heavy-metal-associated domain-containing protein n=1 Tax=Georgenia wangjunii TaxID=3117730 RepID=UPI002F25F217
MSADPAPIDRTTVLDVEGMTCGHCVSAVTNELTELPHVSNVSVILRKGGASEVTVVSDAVLDQDALRAAVDEAGYTVTAVHVDD